MCLEDVKIERELRTRVYFADGTNVATVAIPANPSRISIRLMTPSGGFAQLVAAKVPTANRVGPQDIGLGFVAFDFNGSVTQFTTPPNDINLSNVGDILKGDLVLSTNQSGGWAVETYLDIATSMTPEVTTLAK